MKQSSLLAAVALLAVILSSQAWASKGQAAKRILMGPVTRSADDLGRTVVQKSAAEANKRAAQQQLKQLKPKPAAPVKNVPRGTPEVFKIRASSTKLTTDPMRSRKSSLEKARAKESSGSNGYLGTRVSSSSLQKIKKKGQTSPGVVASKAGKTKSVQSDVAKNKATPAQTSKKSAKPNNISNKSVKPTLSKAPVKPKSNKLQSKKAKTEKKNKVKGTLSQNRMKPGVATSQGQLKKVTSSTWLQGRSSVSIPGQVAEKLSGRQYKNFDHFRSDVWKTIASDKNLSRGFSQSNLKLMSEGKAPFAPEAQHRGMRARYELDHTREIQDGGAVYSFDNIRIKTPDAHARKLTRKANRELGSLDGQ